MVPLHTEQPSKIYRGTLDEVLSHRSEIPAGATVELKILPPTADGNDPVIALLESWIADAPTDPAEIKEAEADLREFKRNVNRWRKEVGARLPYPEAE